MPWDTLYMKALSITKAIMSKEEQDTILGGLIRSRQETVRKLGALKAKAGDIGHYLETLGKLLKNDPGMVSFNNQPRNIQRPRKDYSRADCTFDDIATTTDEIADAEIELLAIIERLKPFHVN